MSKDEGNILGVHKIVVDNQLHVYGQDHTDCMCSVKCAEATWNYKSGRHSAL